MHEAGGHGRFPEAGDLTRQMLERHNMRWSKSFGNWLRHVSPPFWGRGLILDPELRGKYETWLPCGEFMDSLKSVGLAWLPSPEWLPLPLRRREFQSLPDMWAAMPEGLAGRLLFGEDDLLPLFCALADPPRFGTVPGRYGRQLSFLKSRAFPGMRIVEVACGVGLYTLEAAKELSSVGNVELTGMTAEHLEVWMAEKRLVPHDPIRQAQMDRLRQAGSGVRFRYGRAEGFSMEGRCDAVLCNGLLGGRFFDERSLFLGFVESCRRILNPGGIVLVSNKFHEGFRPGVLRFLKCAAECGFHVSGDWHDAVLTLRG